MNVSFLLEKYFDGAGKVSIDVFDAVSLNTVYKNVMDILTSHFDIEISILQAVSYCFYEILDNVHIHSGKPLGTALTSYDTKKNVLKVLVADDGQGICSSLRKNPEYSDISEAEALSSCILDSVTDGKGMGFGLFATQRLIKDAGIRFIIHSGNHKLIMENGKTTVVENGPWQGTIVYMEILTDVEINPQTVVDNRTDAVAEFNEQFVDDDDFNELWSFKTSEVLSFSEYGSDFGTREDGVRLRKMIVEKIKSSGKITLDFTGVRVVSNSFADECIAKLLLDMSFDELRQRVSFKGLNSLAASSVLVALQRRKRHIQKQTADN